MKFSMGLIALTVFAALNSSAAPFAAAFVDSSGLKWSHVLSQKFTNGCTNASDQLDASRCSLTITSGRDSSAEAACEALGGKLPSQHQFEVLVRDFDHSENDNQIPYLTDVGLTKMQSTFDNDWNPLDGDMFWTSTVNPDPHPSGYATSFLGQVGLFDFGGFRPTKAMVRCVSR